MKSDLPKLKFIHIKNIFKKNKLKDYFHKIASLEITSNQIAFSLAFGIFIGTLIPIGLQTIIIIPLVLLLKGNLFLAYLATFISNPITIIPIYLLALKIGIFFTNSKINVEKIMELIGSGSYNKILSIGTDGLISLIIGVIILSIISSVITYFVSLNLVKYYRNNKNITPNL